ncbi:sensor histidine kinase [Paenarthrobacter sp. DKR-5]|uniref:sensor histidine kinase n=1 Tax=Paenarthrobacter sp. DKR-5 TaxID=2835535 RepID=UPI001BDDBB0C|nr:sensor histidine kinase [Paenarthrobacter sp. DKR-5]MBT1002193.1 sensor histidine kinase [Paenarthrobacter sp. DKR-5]
MPGRHWSLARRLFVGQLLFLFVMTGLVATAVYLDVRDKTYHQAQDRMLAVATSIADNPLVLTAATGPDPSSRLQPYARKVMQDAGIDFITIMAPDRTRWTHPNPDEIGKPYIGSVDQALQGRPFTEIYAGTLGPSVRAIVPVADGTGKVRAMVAAGVTVTNVSVALNARLPAIFGVALALLAGGSLVSWLLGRYLRRVTLGWGPEQLGQLFAFYDSVLHSVREGLLLVDRKGEVVLYNDQAAALLAIPPRTTGTPSLKDLQLPASLADLLASGRSARDEIHLTDSRVLVVNQEPARPPGEPQGRRAQPLGTVTTLRDHTELEALSGELQSMRTLSDALRSQTHEHSNRMHTIVSLLELGRSAEALDFAAEDLHHSQQLADEVVGSVHEPVLAALLMGKAAQANERGIALAISTEGELEGPQLDPHDLVTIVGNLVDNALDAAAGADAPRQVDVTLRVSASHAVIEVADSGPGIDEEEARRVIERGYSTKEPGEFGRGIGLALVRQAVDRLGGTLQIGKRKGAVFTVTVPLGPETKESGRQ